MREGKWVQLYKEAKTTQRTDQRLVSITCEGLLLENHGGGPGVNTLLVHRSAMLVDRGVRDQDGEPRIVRVQDSQCIDVTGTATAARTCIELADPWFQTAAVARLDAQLAFESDSDETVNVRFEGSAARHG
jgi:hypothetical protein